MRTLTAFFALALTIACGTQNTPQPASAEPPEALTQARIVTIDFNEGEQGFAAGFADYPLGEEDFYELHAGLSPLPSPLDGNQRGFKLSGNNHSDDLLMFVQGPVHDLAPGGAYHASMCVEFASDAPNGSIGIGGSPADSVYVKLGFVSQAAHVNTVNDYQRVAMDVGSQGQGGADAEVVGTIGVDTDDGETGHWQIKKLCTQDARMHAQSADGTAWAFVGFDSGFEATTTVYVTKVSLTLQ